MPEVLNSAFASKTIRMKTFEMLSKIKASIAALVLLGLAELVVIDTSAGFIKMANLAGSGFFIVATGFIVLLTAIILCWSALKLRYSYEERLVEGIRAGATAGFSASLGICAFMLLFALFGVGVPSLMPSSVTDQGTTMTIFAYLALSAGTVIFYSAMGALLGALSALIATPVRRVKLDMTPKPKHKPMTQAHVQEKIAKLNETHSKTLEEQAKPPAAAQDKD